MFENLTDKLQRAFKNLRGQGSLTEENMDEALKEIRLALLEADVNFKVVKELIDQIRVKALGTEVLTSLSPAEMVIKVVRDELVETLGRDTAKFKFASQPPTVVLMAGLQGSGKTTTSGKLAGWFKKGGHRPMLVSVDVYRPAAREQHAVDHLERRAIRERGAERRRKRGAVVGMDALDQRVVRGDHARIDVEQYPEPLAPGAGFRAELHRPVAGVDDRFHFGRVQQCRRHLRRRRNPLPLE